MTTTFKRMEDGKLFYADSMALMHWSTIRAEDGEEDSVKWYGAKQCAGYGQLESYVSATRGYGYWKLPRID